MSPLTVVNPHLVCVLGGGGLSPRPSTPHPYVPFILNVVHGFVRHKVKRNIKKEDLSCSLVLYGVIFFFNSSCLWLLFCCLFVFWLLLLLSPPPPHLFFLLHFFCLDILLVSLGGTRRLFELASLSDGCLQCLPDNLSSSQPVSVLFALVCVCVCMCVCVCACVNVHACVGASMSVCVCVVCIQRHTCITLLACIQVYTHIMNFTLLVYTYTYNLYQIMNSF